MATSSGIPPSTTEEQDIPQTDPSATTSPTSASTATAPSYSPIYATAQPAEMTTLSGAPDLSTDLTPTVEPLPTSTSSPPPPQPGAVPDPSTTSDTTSQQQQNSPPYPDPAPAPKTGSAALTPAAVLPESQEEHLAPAAPPTKDPPIITAPPAYPPAPASTSTSNTSAAAVGAVNQHPQTVAPPRNSYTTYPSSYSYSPNRSAGPTQQPNQIHAHVQQPQYPNSTTTPYTAVYSPGSTSAQNTLPLHYNTSTGGYDGTNDPGENEAGLWGNAKSWLQTAGNKLAEVEAEVWRRINDAHDK